MPEPKRRTEDEATKPSEGATPDADIARDDAVDEAVAEREAREEAEKLNAVPYERFKKTEGA